MMMLHVLSRTGALVATQLMHHFTHTHTQRDAVVADSDLAVVPRSSAVVQQLTASLALELCVLQQAPTMMTQTLRFKKQSFYASDASMSLATALSATSAAASLAAGRVGAVLPL